MPILHSFVPINADHRKGIITINQINLKRHEEKFEEIITAYKQGNISKSRKEVMISALMSAIESECGGINSIMRRKDNVTTFYEKIRSER